MARINTPVPRAETQQERWLKYGANVVLACVVLILLAAGIVWLAQGYNRRMDMTRGGLYSLKPQTVNIIRENKQDIKIYSLYTRAKAETTSSDEPAYDFAQPVADLLEEYKRKGSHIDVEAVDPVSQPTKVDQLIEEVTRKYGGEVQKYKAVVDEYPKIYEQISAIAGEEAKKVQSLPLKEITDEDLGQTIILTVATVQGFPKFLEEKKEGIERRLKQKPPDYKGATSSIESGMSSLSQLVERIIEDFKKSKDDQKVPQPIRAYMAESLPKYEQIKKLADDFDKKIKDLGELKLDELRQSLRARDAILVMGPNDMRVIPFEKVWQVAEDSRGFTAEGKPKPRFAGEQQVTSAILSLTAKSKPKVVFVRPGGAPLTSPGIPGFQAGGPLSIIADRLRDYNYDVLEKDLSGMWAMQAQMQQMPSPPEPTDEQIKDAVWVVLNFPSRGSPMGPPPTIAPKVAEHLKNGGSALVLSMPQTDNLSGALDEWGVKLRTDAIAVHEKVESGARGSDGIEDAMRVPFIFTIKDYGDHMLTRPLRSLDSVLVPLCVVETQPKQGFTATKILPVPQTLKTWGETKVDEVLRTGEAQYNAPKGAAIDSDVPPPLFGGAAVEKSGGGRVVVIGCLQFVLNEMLNIPDPNLLRQGILVARFPGNSELFMNSIFWLSKMDPMIAISPAAMEVSRVAEISPGALNAWRIGVLLVALPGAVILAGMWVYFSRRD